MKNTHHYVHLCKLLIVGLMLVLTSPETQSQVFADRVALASELNTALADLGTYIQTYVNTNPPLPVSLSFTLNSNITVKSYDGTCITPPTYKLVWLPHADPSDPTSSAGLRIEVVQRAGGSEMDIPELSHDLVCSMNTWLYHAFNGNLRENWSKDEDGNEVLEDWAHFDANCGSTSQKYWMVDAANTVIDDRLTTYSGLYIGDDMWRPLREHNGPLSQSGQEVIGVIRDADLVKDANETHHIWIARRDDEDETKIEIKRAYTKVTFDDDYPGTTYDYFTSSYPKKLRGLELTARIHGYSPDDCPQGTGAIQPNSSKAELIFKILYESSGTLDSIMCEDAWGSVGNEDANNTSLWERMRGYLNRDWGEFDIDEDGMLYFETRTQCSGVSSPERYGLVRLRSRAVPADQCEQTLGYNGTFNIDPMTGDLTYTYSLSGETITEKIFCFDFCDDLSGTLAFDNVISSSAHTFRDDWKYPLEIHGAWSDGNSGGSTRYANGDVSDPYQGMPDNLFQRAERGRWLPENFYAYRTDVKSAVGGEKVYDNAGLYVDDVDENGNTEAGFDLFTWRNPSQSSNMEPEDKWIKPMTISLYSPAGELIEEHNSLDIYNTIHLAHKEAVPNLAAQNATYDAVDFESFEDETWWANWDEDQYNTSEWHPNLDETVAHSGSRSFLLPTNDYSLPVASVKLTEQIDEAGVLIKFWVKQTYKVYDANPSFSGLPVLVKFGGVEYSTPAPANYNTLEADVVHKVAQTGEWTLYQLVLDDSSFTMVDPVPTLDLRLRNNLTTYEDDVWIDDVRIQPLNASMTCFVYDRNTLRPTAVFDDQHFGLYSRYDGEGRVTSVLRETERGIVTVSDVHSWAVTQPRNPNAGSSSSIYSGGGSDFFSRGMNVGPMGMRNDIGENFSIVNLQIGSQGPTAELFGGEKMSLDALGGLLDFRSELPNLDSKRLAELTPGLSEVQRLQLIKELHELDKERQKLEEELQNADESNARETAAVRLKKVEEKRDALLRVKLGLSDDEITALYQQLESARDTSVEE